MPGHSLEDLKATAESLPDRVREAYVELITSWAMDWIGQLLDACESPIEQLLCLELSLATLTVPLVVKYDKKRTVYLAVFPQDTKRTPTATYRVDFRVVLTHDECEYVALVECDGHEFHERTKEQAGRDKARDRDLQAHGYAVLRFTGSEIWADPRACADEVVNLLLKRAGLK